MTVGEKIRQRRKELDMSVDELADILGKNRATVYRYESDEIENLSITVLEPLASALRTTPGALMGWIDENEQTANEIDNNTNNLLQELISCYNTLNKTGMEEALKRVRELTYIPSYQKDGGN